MHYTVILPQSLTAQFSTRQSHSLSTNIHLISTPPTHREFIRFLSTRTIVPSIPFEPPRPSETKNTGDKSPLGDTVTCFPPLPPRRRGPPANSYRTRPRPKADLSAASPLSRPLLSLTSQVTNAPRHTVVGKRQITDICLA